MISEEKIWEYLDGNLHGQERQELEYAIANDKDISSLYKELTALHTKLHSQSAEQPSMAFTENVMRAVQTQSQYRTAPKVPVLPLVVSAVPFLVLIILASMYLISSTGVAQVYHVNPEIQNIIKMLILLADAVLLVFFLEDWFLSGKNPLA